MHSYSSQHTLKSYLTHTSTFIASAAQYETSITNLTAVTLNQPQPGEDMYAYTNPHTFTYTKNPQPRTQPSSWSPAVKTKKSDAIKKQKSMFNEKS